MTTAILKLVSALSLTMLLLSTVTFGQAVETQNVTASGQPEIYFVPDVIGQFNKLALRPDALAFGKDGQPDPDIRKHFQGIVRKHGPGTPLPFLVAQRERRGLRFLQRWSGEHLYCPNDLPRRQWRAPAFESPHS